MHLGHLATPLRPEIIEEICAASKELEKEPLKEL